VTVIAVPTPFVSQGQALDFLTRITHEAASSAYRIDTSGTAAPVRAGVGRIRCHACCFAVIIIYLALARAVSRASAIRP